MTVLLKHIKCPHSSESVKTIMSLKINVWGRRVQKDQAPDPHGNFQSPQHVHITTFLQKQQSLLPNTRKHKIPKRKETTMSEVAAIFQGLLEKKGIH